MTRSLVRPCLARGCGNVVRGKSYCHDCQRTKDQAKRVRRPDLHNDHTERQRRARAVADHRALLGDWCPGWAKQPAHPSADLTADHVREVSQGGDPYGALVVRCRSCNAARSANIAARILTSRTPHDPAQGGAPITQAIVSDSVDTGPTVA